MGEQTDTLIETLAEPDSQSQSQDETPKSQPTDSKPQSSADSNAVIPPPPLPVSDASLPITTEISQSASKIPIRPQKIRKLSTPLDDNKPSSTGDSSAASTAATVASSSSLTLTTATTTKSRRRSASQASRALPQVIKPLSSDGEIDFALRHLRVADPLLIPLMDTHARPQFESHQPPFLALTKSILYQQLAYKAGTSIYTRFISLCGGEDSVRPDNVLALSSQQLKQIGVSGRKATYLYDLANKYNSGILSDDTVVKMDDRSLFTMLSMVKGIGSWSVHMFMIFSLHRPDVLPVSDLGVRKGVQLLYGLEDLPRPSQMEQLCEKWRPYRSVGAWYMWRFVEGKEGPPVGSGVSLESNIVQPLQQIEPHQDGQQQQHQQQQQQQHQLQFVEPVNGIGNLG
ncbi:hypothetical protein ACJIZ3_014466 [Penstemon smallii]|uniref:HhH-GPD domain-containing protein n=1 Tax=Penstemon smallii TaxID=265156 RepID=A0ABD3RJR7_9LAMI